MVRKGSKPLGEARLDQPRAQTKEDETAPSFSPHRITLETFHHLLSIYEATVSQVHRRKVTLKLQPKPAKGSKEKAGAPVITKTEFNDSEEKQIREQTDKFLELDRWRYETLPNIVAERKACAGEKEGNETDRGYLLKEELVDIMDWKMKHGVFRPALMGMVKSNPDKTVTQSTSTAFAVLPDADPISAPAEAFPKSSLDALTSPLRGVGPATASLILSIGTIFGDANMQVPFYSDDVYLWLVLNDFRQSADEEEKPSTNKKPNGELIAKYNVNEYRDLWNAVQKLRARLNADDTKAQASNREPVSLADIEKVAYVIRNIALSGFAGQGLETISQESAIIEPLEPPKKETATVEISQKRKSEADTADVTTKRQSKRLKQ